MSDWNLISESLTIDRGLSHHSRPLDRLFQKYHAVQTTDITACFNHHFNFHLFVRLRIRVWDRQASPQIHRLDNNFQMSRQFSILFHYLAIFRPFRGLILDQNSSIDFLRWSLIYYYFNFIKMCFEHCLDSFLQIQNHCSFLLHYQQMLMFPSSILSLEWNYFTCFR